VAAHEELFNILRDTRSIVSTLQNLRADLGIFKEDAAHTRVIATNVQCDIVHMDNHLEKVASVVDALHTDVRKLGHDISQVVSNFTGVDPTVPQSPDALGWTLAPPPNKAFFF
jgi:hypothetical protein